MPTSTRAHIPPAIAELLGPGEQVAWVGAPRRRMLNRDEAFKLPVALVVIVLGWLLLNRRVPIVVDRLTIPPFVFGFVMLAGVYYGAVRPWRAWRVRARTTYAVTDRRAIIVEDGRYVASYFLNPKFKIGLAPADKGGATIRFAVVPREEVVLSFLAPRLSRFTNIEDAREVYNLILALRDRYRAGVADVGTDVPYAKRLNPLRDHDTAFVPGVTADGERPLNYAEPIRQVLRRGERTLYVARPPQGFLFRATDWFVMPLALLWTAFWARVAYYGIASGCPGLLALLFVGIGLHVLAWRFVADRRERRRTWYTVTDRRCLVVIEGKVIETKSVYWNFIQGIVRQQHADGTATVYFELTPEAKKTLPDDVSETAGLRHPPGVYFERIEDAGTVETLVMANVSS